MPFMRNHVRSFAIAFMKIMTHTLSNGDSIFILIQFAIPHINNSVRRSYNNVFWQAFKFEDSIILSDDNSKHILS